MKLADGMTDIFPIHSIQESAFDDDTAEAAVTSDSSTDSEPAIHPALLLLAVAPFLAVPLAHWASDPDTATGFFHYELPYYVANGRAAFERGNGLSYPNPYDASATAPAIYIHWLPWLLGLLTAPLGADPGMLVLGLTGVAALGLAEATRRLVGRCVPESGAAAGLIYLAAMWGGGALVLGGLLTQPVPGNATDLLRLDPGRGLWFLNWGRNSLFPTEATYHILTALCWLTELQRRRWAASGFLLLLATTHPWSGLELLLTICLWRSICCLRIPRREELCHAAVATIVLMGFLAYYKVWLPSFPQHAKLQDVWELDWSLPWSSAIPAWGPVALLAAARLFKDPDCIRSPTVGFLICAAIVAAGLSLHDRLIAPVQPIHFTRGYVWMPLFLLGAPVLVESGLQMWRRSTPARLAVCGLGLLLALDNLTFSAVHLMRQWRHADGFHLTLHERALLARLHRSEPQAVVMTDSMTVNYLLPAYAAVRPWLGHQFNTPDFPAREDRMKSCFADGGVRLEAIPDEVNVLAVSQERDCRNLAASGIWIDWSPDNAEWNVWLRVNSMPANPDNSTNALFAGESAELRIGQTRIGNRTDPTLDSR